MQHFESCGNYIKACYGKFVPGEPCDAWASHTETERTLSTTLTLPVTKQLTIEHVTHVARFYPATEEEAFRRLSALSTQELTDEEIEILYNRIRAAKQGQNEAQTHITNLLAVKPVTGRMLEKFAGEAKRELSRAARHNDPIQRGIEEYRLKGKERFFNCYLDMIHNRVVSETFTRTLPEHLIDIAEQTFLRDYRGVYTPQGAPVSSMIKKLEQSPDPLKKELAERVNRRFRSRRLTKRAS